MEHGESEDRDECDNTNADPLFYFLHHAASISTGGVQVGVDGPAQLPDTLELLECFCGVSEAQEPEMRDGGLVVILW